MRAQFSLVGNFLVVAALVSGASISYAAGRAPISCPQALSSVQTSVETFLAEASLSPVEGQPTKIANDARLQLVEKLGAGDALGLFGPEFNQWPLVLGTSADGHIILAKTEAPGDAVTIISVKPLALTVDEYLKRSDLDFDVAVRGKAEPVNYESLTALLERTEGEFNRVTSAFQQRTKQWVTADYNRDHLTWAVRFTGVIGSLSKPWIIRSTKMYTPSPDGKSATPSTPKEISALVSDLLKAK